MIKDLYSGDELSSWMYINENPEPNDMQFVTVQFYQNGVSLEIPIDSFKKVVEELMRTAKALSVFESRN